MKIQKKPSTDFFGENSIDYLESYGSTGIPNQGLNMISPVLGNSVRNRSQRELLSPIVVKQ